MTTREKILRRCRENTPRHYDMPDLSAIDATAFPEPVAAFAETTVNLGSTIVEARPGENINDLIRRYFPDAGKIASNVEEITIATANPDTVPDAQTLDGTDLGIVKGTLGVAENGCIWVPQTMKERAVCFISEQLAILLPKSAIVSNMHEAYRRIVFNDYGYGVFICGPSKTADIAQVLVMGAQAARAVKVILLPE